MKIYNSQTRQKEEFIPIEKNKLSMYVCGPTVYNYIHIGNARAFTIFDVIRRYFEYLGYEVNYSQNLTDIDDKIIKRANEEGVTMTDISERYIAECLKDSDALGVKRATVYPRATQHIDGIIDICKTLIEKGFAYEKNGTVFFDTSKKTDYGKLSGRKIDEQEAGARIEVDTEKKNPMDFVLWKPTKPNEPYWESPWGIGRPGWHIECSAMIKKHFGDTIDIHAGGEDLLFPHHENEIAQSEAASGKPLANYWLHNGMINIDNKKMSKSKNNFFSLREVIESYPYDIVRFFLISNHYRSPLNFGMDMLEAAKNSLGRIRNCYAELEKKANSVPSIEITDAERSLLAESGKFRKDFTNSMNDDFNTANAITAIFDLVKFINININVPHEISHSFANALLHELAELCGVLNINLLQENNMTSDLAGKVEALIEDRKSAKLAKDFTRADEIRKELEDMNIIIKDTRDGTVWAVKA